MRWRKAKKKERVYKSDNVKKTRVGDSREITKFAFFPTHISKYNMVFWEKYIIVEKYSISYLAEDTIGVIFRRMFTKNNSNAFFTWDEVGKKYIN